MLFPMVSKAIPALFLVMMGGITDSQAVTLISDDFSGTGNLNGSTPDVSIASTTWIANSAYATGSGTLGRTGTGASGAGIFLGNTIGSSPGIYELSADIAFAANGSPGTGVHGIGFSASQTITSVYTDASPTTAGRPWMFLRENGLVEIRSGTTTIFNSGTPVFGSGTGYNLRMVLDTSAASWTLNAFVTNLSTTAVTQIDLNGATAGSTYTYAINPTDIAYVGLTSTTVLGRIDNFLLTGPVIIPEPSAALLAAGALGFSILRRRR